MTHRYPHPKTGKRSIPSVTEIIGDCTDKSGALTQWAANQVAEWIRQNCNEVVAEDLWRIDYGVYEDDLEQAVKEYRNVSQTALDVGSEVHNLAEQFLCGEHIDPIENVQIRAGFDAFMTFFEQHEIITYKTEHSVVGETPCGKLYGGTLDVYWEIQRKCDSPLCYCHKVVGLPMVTDFKTSNGFYPDQPYQVAAYRNALEQQNVEVEAGSILRLDKLTGEPHFKVCLNYERDLDIFCRMTGLFYARHPRIAKAVYDA